VRVPDEYCPSCKQTDHRFHFLSCSAHASVRAKITRDVLQLLNSHRTQPSSSVPAYWDPENSPACHSPFAHDFMQHTIVDAARAIIPKSFSRYIESQVQANTDLDQLIANIQLVIVSRLRKCWVRRCRTLFSYLRTIDNQPSNRNLGESRVDRITRKLRTRRGEQPPD